MNMKCVLINLEKTKNKVVGSNPTLATIKVMKNHNLKQTNDI